MSDEANPPEANGAQGNGNHEPEIKRAKLSESMEQVSGEEAHETGTPSEEPTRDVASGQCPWSSTVSCKKEEEVKAEESGLVEEGEDEDGEAAEEDAGEEESETEEEEDVDQLLEAPINEAKASQPPGKRPRYKEKTVLKHRSTEYFEVLPEGWIEVTHRSGLPVYLHKASRVCTFSRPYFLGPGSVRNHAVPLAAIPCLHQARVQEEEAAREAEGQSNETLAQLGAPVVKVQTADDFRRRNLSSDALRAYANSRFKFHTIRVLRFGTWSANRSFHRRKRLARHNGVPAPTPAASSTNGPLSLGLGRPSLPSHVTLITVPQLEHNAKPQHKPFFINPDGKTSIAVLHEFVQKILKGNVQYDFNETRNAAHPYSATVRLSAGQKGRERMSQIIARLPADPDRKKDDPWLTMGTGFGNSKKNAKLDAAQKALEILMPGDLHFNEQGVAGRTDGEISDSVALFDLLPLLDQRVVEMSAKAGQPAPYVILHECLKQHSAFGNTQVKCRMERTGHKQHVFHMTVGKHEVSVPCTNKKEGKQKASQSMLAKLLPHVSTWGSLIRLYGSAAHRKHQPSRRARKKYEQRPQMEKDAKRENNSVLKLQTSGKSNAAPNTAILQRLREQMAKLASAQSLQEDLTPSTSAAPHTLQSAPPPPPPIIL